MRDVATPVAPGAYKVYFRSPPLVQMLPLDARRAQRYMLKGWCLWDASVTADGWVLGLVFASTGLVPAAGMFKMTIEALCDFLEPAESQKVDVIRDIAAPVADMAS